MRTIKRDVARKLALVVFIALVCVTAPRTSLAFGWSLIDAKIRREFPEVKRITTAELAAWLDDRRRSTPSILDVRTAAEYGVSHLPGAQHVEPDAAASVITLPKDQPIVTYCSVGYRSARFGERLRAAGYSNVRNLDGSIFRWANEGRPVVRTDARVDKVHPYNRTWGLLLHKRYRADVVPVKS